MSCHIPVSMCVGVTVWLGWVVWYPYVITHTHDIRIYSENIIKNTLHTRELKNHRTPQETIFTETHIKTTTHITTKHSPLNKDTNAKNLYNYRAIQPMR